MTRARETSENARLAKAWVNFNGTGTVSIRADFNVSSIDDGGVGVYTINFESPMTDTDYSAAGTCSTTTLMGIIWDGGAGYTRTSSAYKFSTMYVNNLAGNGTEFDTSIVQLIIFR
jgi:hypothetical protein